MKDDITGLDRLDLTRNDLTDGIIDMLRLIHTSLDDNPTAGDGIGVTWRLEESTNNSVFEAAALDILSTDIASGAEDIDWRLSTMIAGTLTEFLHVDADGGFIVKISPLIVRSDDPTTEIMIDNTAVDGDPYLSWALSGVRQFTLGVDDGDSDILKLGTTAIGTGTMLEVDTEIRIVDDINLAFGDDSDFTIVYDAAGDARLEIDPSAPDGVIAIGANNVADIIITGDASTLTWDADGDTDGELIMDGGRIRINDDDTLVFGDSAEASFEYDEDGTNHLRYDGVDMVFDTATQLLFRDDAIHINSSVDGQMDIDADVEVEITSPTFHVVASTEVDFDSDVFSFGTGAAATDVVLNFIGETSSGVLTWMEDEDYFEYTDDILVAIAENVYFRDTAIHINSSVDGQLDIDADGEVEVTAPIFQVVASNQVDLDSNTFNLGAGAEVDVAVNFIAASNNGLFTWMEDEDYFEFADEILMSTTEAIYFRDTALLINSSVDGQLDIDADIEIEITAPTVQIAAATALDVDSDAIYFGTGGAGADVVFTVVGETNTGVFTWMEDENYFEYSNEILMTVGSNIYFRDVAIHINSSADGQLDIDADGEVEITSPIVQIVASNQFDVDTNTFNFGAGADVDVAVNFVATTNSGLFTWMEDEDYFEYSDDILMTGAEQLYFRDIALTIFSSVDGQLDIDADVEIELTAPTIDIAGLLTLTVDDANNVTVTDVLTITHTTTGVAGPGIGTGLSFGVEDLGGAQQQGSIDVVMTDVTNLTEDADMAFSVIVNGTITEMMRLNADGGIEIGWNADVDVPLTFTATTNDGVLTWMEDEDYFEYSDDILMNTTENIYFRDVAIHLNSSVDGQLDIDADGEVEITSPIVQIVAATELDVDTNTFNLGAGGEVDIAMNFIAASNSGLFTWMEDEDYFEFADDILLSTTEQLYFRDTALTIFSSADGQLDIDADVEIELTAPTIDIAGLLTLTVDDANNVTVTDVLTITHTTTGVAGPGIGTGLSFGVEDLGGAQQQGSIDVVMTDVTNLTEDADMAFSVIVNGTITEMMRLNADGGIEIGWNTDTDVPLTFRATTNDGLFTWMEDEDYFEYSDDILMNTTENIYFRDVAIYINSSVDGQLDIDADGEVEITSPIVHIVAATQLDVDTNTFNLGAGGEVDIAMNFIAASNSGLFTWMEDEDYFEFADEILMSTTEQIYFRDTALTIYSSVDGQLDIDADVEVEITTVTLDINSDAIQFGTNAEADIVMSFDAATNDGEFKWMEDEDYFEFTDDILVAVAENIYFRDVDIHINSSVDGQLDIDADGEVEITSPIVQIVASTQLDVDTNTFNLGAGADVDIAMNFIATTNSGLFTWMEDEDYFEFADEILMSTTEQIYFRDTALTIFSSVDGQLDIQADTEVEITATTIDLIGNVDISAGLDVTGAITVTTTVDGVDIAGFNAVQFVAIALDGNVANERVLTAGDGIDLTDGGAGGNATLAVDVTDILGNGLGETTNDIYVYELRSSDDGEAALTADADGRLSRPDCEFATKYEWIEDFDDEAAGVQFEAGMVADFWTTAGTNYAAGNVTYQEDAGGTIDALTAGADDDSVTALGLFNWRVDANPIIEARFKVLDITNAFICAGFVEGAFADKAAYDDDIAVVGIDTDNAHGFGAGQIIFVTNDTNAGAVVQDCGVAITLDTFITIRIDLTDTEQPRVWVNNTGGAITAANEVAAGSITGTVQAGISVAPYFMVQSLSAAADTFTIDYIKCWQDRA